MSTADMYKHFIVKYDHSEDEQCVDIESKRVPEEGYIFTLQTAKECLQDLSSEYPCKEKISNARNILLKKNNELEHQAKIFLGPGAAWELQFGSPLHVMDVALKNKHVNRDLPCVKALHANEDEFFRIYNQLCEVDAEIEKLDRLNLNDTVMNEEEYFEFRQILSDSLPHLQ